LKEKIKCYAKGIGNVLQDQMLPCEPIDWLKDASCAYCIFPLKLKPASIPIPKPIPALHMFWFFPFNR